MLQVENRRSEQRYKISSPDTVRVSTAQGHRVSVLDLSASSVRLAMALLDAPNLHLHADIPPKPVLLRLRIRRNALFRRGDGAVYRFLPKTQSELRDLLPKLQSAGLLSLTVRPPVHPRSRREEDVTEWTAPDYPLPPSCNARISGWADASCPGGIGRDIFRALAEAAISKYHFDRTRFQRHLDRVLREIEGAAAPARPWRTIRCVAMRSSAQMSGILQPHFAELVKQWPSKVQIDAAVDAPISGPACLVAVDDHFNHDDVRAAFVRRLVTQYPDAVKRYDRVFLAAVVAFRDVLTVDPAAHLGCGGDPDASEWLLQGRLTSLAGKRLESSDRPFDPAFPIVTPEERRWLRDGLAERIFAPVRGTDERCSLLTFYYGCPPDSMDVLWQPMDGQRPLFPVVDYGEHHSSPTPRPLFFSANPRTLELLRDKIEAHESVLVHAPAGRGKTYLAARALDDLRPRFNGFWHDMTEFDTIENLLDHIDAFLGGFRQPLGLSRDWSVAIAEGDANVEESLARRVAKALRELDRPTVLVFDRLENALPAQKANSHVGHRNRIIALFNALRRALASPPATVPHACAVFIARDHQERPRFSRPSSSGNSPFAALLGLTKEQCLICPDSEIDALGDPRPLVERILGGGIPEERLEAIANQIRLLGAVVPYKTWLLSFCVRRQLLANAQWKSIEQLLNVRHAADYENLDTLHQVVDNTLTREESKLLQVASACRLFWSVGDIKYVYQRAGLTSDPTRLLSQLQADKSPFFVRFGVSLSDRGVWIPMPSLHEPASAHPFEELNDAALFEMPSVTARYYQRRLKDDQKLADRVYEGFASLMQRKIEVSQVGPRPNGSGEARSPDLADPGMGSPAARARVEAMFYYCEARLPGKAARLYANPAIGSDGRDYDFFREQGAFDRIQFLGQTILEAKTSSRDAFPIEVRYETAAMYANSVAELGDTHKAQHICRATLKGHPPKSRYLRARLELLKAKCMQYEGKYPAAINKLESALADLRKSNGDESATAYWSCRGELGLAECLMSIGRLDKAEEHIEAALACQARLGKGARQQRLQISALTERQRGTLCLLRGDLDACQKLASQARDGADVRDRAFWHYRLACVHIEKARIAEAGELKSRMAEVPELSAPSKARLKEHLLAAQTNLGRSRQELLSARPGSPRSYAAIDQASSHAHALARRNGGIDMCEAYDSYSSDSLPHGGNRPPYGSWQGARGLEAELARITLPWQRALDDGDLEQLENRLLKDAPPWWGGAQPSEPHLHSRHCYDRCYYLWRLAILLSDGKPDEEVDDPRLEKTLLQLSEWYRAGTSYLYRCGAFRAAHALHLLACEAFDGHSVGLQDRLEASTWLAVLERGTDLKHDPVRVLRELAVRALAHRTEHADAGDEYSLVAIPAKVMCRLGDSLSQYQEIEDGTTQLRVVPTSRLAMGSREAMCVLCRACWGWMATIGNKLRPSEADVQTHCEDLRKEIGKVLDRFGFGALEAAGRRVAQDVQKLREYLGTGPCNCRE